MNSSQRFAHKVWTRIQEHSVIISALVLGFVSGMTAQSVLTAKENWIYNFCTTEQPAAACVMNYVTGITTVGLLFAAIYSAHLFIIQNRQNRREIERATLRKFLNDFTEYHLKLFQYLQPMSGADLIGSTERKLMLEAQPIDEILLDCFAFEDEVRNHMDQLIKIHTHLIPEFAMIKMNTEARHCLGGYLEMCQKVIVSEQDALKQGSERSSLSQMVEESLTTTREKRPVHRKFQVKLVAEFHKFIELAANDLRKYSD